MCLTSGIGYLIGKLELTRKNAAIGNRAQPCAPFNRYGACRTVLRVQSPCRARRCLLSTRRTCFRWHPLDRPQAPAQKRLGGDERRVTIQMRIMLT